MNDIGNTYVEINIGDQHLWVYKNGEQVNETDFVSGGLFKGNSTPEGTYSITYKERDATLVGEGYQSSVKYWMPFNGNIGLHDASWRDSFGGHIYYMSGSHGCVNLPTAKAAAIYDQVEKGEAVVVYGSISKEQAMSSLNMDDKAKAAQKGYISMTLKYRHIFCSSRALMHRQRQPWLRHSRYPPIPCLWHRLLSIRLHSRRRQYSRPRQSRQLISRLYSRKNNSRNSSPSSSNRRNSRRNNSLPQNDQT